MVIGGLALAYPVAVAEETWNLGENLATWRILLLQLCSMVIVAFYVYLAYHRTSVVPAWSTFLKRVGAIYLVTFVAAASILIIIDKFPLGEFGVAMGRTVVVAFPASFAATIVDGLDIEKEGENPARSRRSS